MDEIHLCATRDRLRGPIDDEEFLPCRVEPLVLRPLVADGGKYRAHAVGSKYSVNFMIDADGTRQRVALRPAIADCDGPSLPPQHQSEYLTDWSLAQNYHVIFFSSTISAPDTYSSLQNSHCTLSESGGAWVMGESHFGSWNEPGNCSHYELRERRGECIHTSSLRPPKDDPTRAACLERSQRSHLTVRPRVGSPA